MLTDDELIAGLRKYIRNNKVIPDFFHRLEEGCHPDDALHLSQLKMAIAEANPAHDIFSNQYCTLYLLYLIEHKQIPFWQGITVYFYCIALMQLTEKQSLRESDERYHLERQSVSVHFIMKDGVLTSEGEKYLNHIEKRYAAFPMLGFNRASFLAQVAPLAPVDQWLMVIGGRGRDTLPDYVRARTTLLGDILYAGNDSDDSFAIPSFACMHIFHQMQCEKPMTLMPILGSIGRKTLVGLHGQDVHPLALYSPFIKSNAMKVHDYDCGPLFVALHDVDHSFMGNLLSFQERQQIVLMLAPRLKERAQELLHCKNREKFEGAIDRVAFEWCDFNFSRIQNLPSQRSEWMMFYLLCAFGRSYWLGNFNFGLYAREAPQFTENPLLYLVQDDLLYCLGVMASEGGIWRELFDRSYASAKARGRHPQVLEQIMAAVEASQPKCKPALTAIGLFAQSEKQAVEGASLRLPASLGN